jgi:hypothetical protein
MHPIYMLLAEILDINDNTLKNRLRLPAALPPLSGDKPLLRSGLVVDPNRGSFSRPFGVQQADKHRSHSGRRTTVASVPCGTDRILQAPGKMIVQCLDAVLVILSFVDALES